MATDSIKYEPDDKPLFPKPRKKLPAHVALGPDPVRAEGYKQEKAYKNGVTALLAVLVAVGGYYGVKNRETFFPQERAAAPSVSLIAGLSPKSDKSKADTAQSASAMDAVDTIAIGWYERVCNLFPVCGSGQ